MYNKLVLAIPHATRSVLSNWDDSVLLAKDADRWTDWHTDTMFGIPFSSDKIPVVKGTISRFDCDLERLQNDPLELEGRGIIYRRSHSGAVRISSDRPEEELIDAWNQYRSQIVDSLVDNSLIIDCHSFPSDISNVDICIGYNEDSSRPPHKIIELISEHFKGHGYSVGINEPYSNAISPHTNKIYHSVMIELNKKIYLDETTFSLKAFAYKLHYCLLRLYTSLLK